MLYYISLLRGSAVSNIYVTVNIYTLNTDLTYNYDLILTERMGEELCWG